MNIPSPVNRIAAWLPGLRLLVTYDRSYWRHDLTVKCPLAFQNPVPIYSPHRGVHVR